MDETTVAQAHQIDTLHTQATRLLRANRQSADLLTDALHALHAGQLDVVAEFLDRTIGYLDAAS